MKKLFCILAVLCLALPLTVAAEETGVSFNDYYTRYEDVVNVYAAVSSLFSADISSDEKGCEDGRTCYRIVRPLCTIYLLTLENSDIIESMYFCPNADAESPKQALIDVTYFISSFSSMDTAFDRLASCAEDMENVTNITKDTATSLDYCGYTMTIAFDGEGVAYALARLFSSAMTDEEIAALPSTVAW